MHATRRNTPADPVTAREGPGFAVTGEARAVARETPAPPLWGPEERRSLHRQLAGASANSGAPWDLVVVGAGITGAGIARDAASRGLRVLVLEASDLAFGTSSRSSRLIHGGVRYLEQGELGLVYEALRERGRLYRTAGHLVRPASFLFPTYRGDRLALWKLRIGLSLYDALSLYRSRHRTLNAANARELEPLLAAAGLRGAVVYEDAVTDDARLTLTILQGARRWGAEILTYSAVRAIHRGAAGYIVETADELRIPARQVLVAAGPWTGERLLGAAGRQLLSLSKGIHLVMRAADLPIRQPLVVQVPGAKRIVFVVPWGARTYLGTTDTAYTGDPGESGVDVRDRDELFGLLARVLPGAPLRPERVIAAWSGVRPLVRSGDPGETSTISRRHRLIDGENGVLGLVGGKLTTYRAMAEEAVDSVIARLVERGGAPAIGPCVTDREPLVPGEPLGAEELAEDPLLADLEPRHGPLARLLAARARADSSLGGGLAARVVDDLPYRWVEIDWAIDYEGVCHLDDLLRRRLPLALTDRLRGQGIARRVAERLIDARGGSGRDVDQEVERYRELLNREAGGALAGSQVT